MDGEQVVSIESMRLNYDMSRDDLERRVDCAHQPEPAGRRAGAERERRLWTFARLVKRRGDQNDRPGERPRSALNAIEITDGSVAIRGPWPDGALKAAAPVRPPRREDGIHVSERATRSIDIAQLSFRGLRAGDRPELRCPVR